mmetsp:Transcript_44162/g.116893  ORF Transcript_44162/g.116893 Transcript_44162/m.116893 type:complete len:201 (-) Transcript_44162:510-1112(-)
MPWFPWAGAATAAAVSAGTICADEASAACGGAATAKSAGGSPGGGGNDAGTAGVLEIEAVAAGAPEDEAGAEDAAALLEAAAAADDDAGGNCFGGANGGTWLPFSFANKGWAPSSMTEESLPRPPAGAANEICCRGGTALCTSCRSNPGAPAFLMKSSVSQTCNPRITHGVTNITSTNSSFGSQETPFSNWPATSCPFAL